MIRAIKSKEIAALFLFLSVFFFIPASEAGLKDQVFETTLTNGLKLILLENPKAPLVTFQVWYREGSRNEEWGRTGLSHVLEHMMFKGTEKVSGEEFSRIIEENGGNFNAFTSYDTTAYFENLSSDRVQVAIDLESDRMQNLILREEDCRTERMVVMEERSERDVKPEHAPPPEVLREHTPQDGPHGKPRINSRDVNAQGPAPFSQRERRSENAMRIAELRQIAAEQVDDVQDLVYLLELTIEDVLSRFGD